MSSELQQLDYKRKALTSLLGGALDGKGSIDHYEWEMLFPFLALHQVTPFLYEHIATWPAGQLPPAGVMELWSSEYYGQVVKELRLAQQRYELLLALHQAGVDAIPLKGTWLATSIYPDAVQRPMDDIDIVIRPEQLTAARRAVAELGYRSKGDVEPGVFAKGQGFAHSGMVAPIELQWSLFHESHGRLSPVDMEYIWERTAPGEIGGVPVRVLDPVSHIVYLIYHIQAHLWRFMARAHLDLVLCGRKLGHLLSVAELQREAEQWQLGFRAPFLWQVAHDICGVAPPESLAGWSEPILPLVEERERAVAIALPESSGAVYSTRVLHQLRCGRWWQKPGAALRAVVVTPGQIREKHPVAVRRGGLAAGYAARGWDLAVRYRGELAPGRTRNKRVVEVERDMAERLWLESWCAAQEGES